jgi:phage terminase large subunit-like protein
MSNLNRALELARQIADYDATHKIFQYKDGLGTYPYDFQRKFHAAGGQYLYRLLMAGQQIGKTLCNCVETVYHLTGLYPDWWEGKRFDHPVKWWAGGQSNDKVRDHLQSQLLGPHDDPDKEGTGLIPKDCIGKKTRRAGIPNAIASVQVLHVPTKKWSSLTYKTYEQKTEEWMGETVHGISLDEEPPENIFSQCVIRTMKNNGIVFITATPENGMTEVISQFKENPTPEMFCMSASMDDAGHYTREKIEQAMSVLPETERDMRRHGIPQAGSGLVFPVLDDDISCDPFDLPKYWPRLCAIDFGYDHPFAAVWVAWDRDSDIAYVYDLYRERKATPIIHAQAVKSRGSWIPVVWPHDGLSSEKGSGIALATQYRDPDTLNVNMLQRQFSNPPGPQQKEGEGGFAVEPGIMEMLTRMQTKQLKVFRHLSEWFQEKRSYHRKDGKIVKKKDDLMAATRMGVMSLRHAHINSAVIRKPSFVVGASNW